MQVEFIHDFCVAARRIILCLLSVPTATTTFFGRLHAARDSVAVKEATGLVGKEGAEAFVQRLNPEDFDSWMRKEIAALERCFAA